MAGGRVDLRCPSKLLFGVVAGGLIEVKCRSRRCGSTPEVVVLHYFDSCTGEFVETKRFREPSVLFDERKK